jgi:hypothetical protein
MKTLKNLFSTHPQNTISRYWLRAVDIQTQLNQGIHYQALGGRRLLACHQLIRFKLGKFRLIFEQRVNGLTPEFLLHRKNLDKLLKRRCGR